MKIIILYTIPILMLLLVSGAGCDRSAPDNLIDEDTYVDILVEMHLLASLKEIKDDKESFEEGQKAVLKHYGIDRDQFQNSHEYYHRDMKAQSLRFREVRSRLDKASKDITNHLKELRKSREAEGNTSGDTL